jgi:integrase
MPRPSDWAPVPGVDYVYTGGGRLWIRLTVRMPGGRREEYGPRQCPEEWGIGKQGQFRAHLHAVEMRKRIEAGMLDRSQPTVMTVRDYAQAVRAAAPCAPVTLALWHTSAEHWLQAMGDIVLTDWQLQDVKRWWRDWSQEHADQYKHNTIMAIVGSLRFVTSRAWRSGHMKQDYGASIILERQTAERRENLRVEQLAPAFAGPWSEYWRPFFGLLATCGFRRGEVEQLQPDQLRDGCIWLSDGQTKTRTARRVPVPPELYELAAAWAARPERVARVTVAKVFHRGAKACGIVGFTPHSLRRMVVSELLSMGYREALVSALVGHSAKTMTQYYDGARGAGEIREMVERYWDLRVRHVYAGLTPPPQSGDSKGEQA